MKKLYVDGTFSLAPQFFAQVYVIMAEKGGFVFPVLYALLPDKTQQTYVRMFDAITSTWPHLNPTSISTDFEMAALNAINSVFPDAATFGCLFHLSKNMKKKLTNEGLMQMYNNDCEFALKARMIVALAFVPPDSVEQAFDELSDSCPDTLQPVLNWFEDNYIGRRIRNGRRAATYANAIWTVYQRTLEGLDRTNNHAEAAHRRLQVILKFESL
jgi:MULE transposase domain